MRLTPNEIAAIRDCARVYFGEGAVVRLFGSRVRDDLRGGDIDLHITSEVDDDPEGRNAFRFKENLEQLIGEQRIDLLVSGPTGPNRPIDKIAVATGIIIPEPDKSPGVDVSAVRRSQTRRATMPTGSHRELITEALRSGDATKANLERLLGELASRLPLTPTSISSLDWEGHLRTDSLLLQFSNMVAIVQDQLIRGILIASEEPVARQTRIDQRNVAVKLGAIPEDIDFKAIIDARNGIAHQYPAEPDVQANVINDVARTTPGLIEAYLALAAYARRRGLSDA